MVCITLVHSYYGQAPFMVAGDVGSFDTRYERLTGHYRDLIMRGNERRQLKEVLAG